MNRAQFENHVELQRRLVEFYEKYPRGCAGCVYFKQESAFCDYYKQTVPADFQPKGCDQWEYDDVPF